jgi:hypothetical protein
LFSNPRELLHPFNSTGQQVLTVTYGTKVVQQHALAVGGSANRVTRIHHSSKGFCAESGQLNAHCACTTDGLLQQSSATTLGKLKCQL